MKNSTQPGRLKQATTKQTLKWASGIALMLLTFFNPMGVKAQVLKTYNQRSSIYSPEKKLYNLQGDFVVLGNTNMTLQTYGNNTNNGNSSKYVDIDGDASTVNSSSAELRFSTERGANPECTQVVYAGLYWTGINNTIATTTTTEVNNNGTINGYTMHFSSTGSNNNMTYTYTLTKPGQETIVFTAHRQNNNYYLRVKVGSGPQTDVPHTRDPKLCLYPEYAV